MDTTALISKYTGIRKTKKITQRKLADLSNIPQPAIARLESNSPKGVRVDTLNTLLSCLGYTLEIVPIESKESSYSDFLINGAKILDRKIAEKSKQRKETNERLKKAALKMLKGEN